MAVDWLNIKSDYINGLGSYRKLSEKYGVSANAICTRAKSEGWKKEKEEHLDKTCTRIVQETANVLVEQGVDRATRLLSASDQLIGKIEKAIEELDMAQVTAKKKTKVIEYKNPDRADKPTKEIIDEQEAVLAVKSIIDRKGLQQVATALKAVWDISIDGGNEPGTAREDDPLTKALREEAEKMNNANQR